MKYKNSNLEFWEAVVPEHVKSDYYDVKGFLKGKLSLDEIEIGQLGNISGKTLLHLQCHFGLSTLSLARLGANVTGIDFSSSAITEAKRLAKLSKIDATFVRTNVYDLSENLQEKFDVVFSSYGVLCWLPDLNEWATQIAACLNHGGTFHLIEFHPLMTALTKNTANELIVENSYFNEGVEVLQTQGSYATADAGIDEQVYEWTHSLADVVTALLKAGLRLESFQEYPFATEGGFVGYLRVEDSGQWTPANHKFKVPLTYSLRATKV